ncbi:MAG: hypothetical protein ACI90V_000195 [Bacillariaceae sp.]|jgi:serine/arginine repetitive matrix protein 1
MPTIKGTASVTDSRARQKALRKTKFPRNFETKVLLQKVNKPVLTQWIEQKVTSLLGFEDEIVASTAINLFLPSDGTCTSPDAKKAQLDLVGFLGEDSAATFSKELWSLMLEAQKSSSGIPQTLLEQKKKDMAERMNRKNNQQQQLKQQQQQQYHQHRSQNNQPPSVPIRMNDQNENGTPGRRRVNRFSRMNQDRGDDNSTSRGSSNNNNNNRPAAELSVPISPTHENNSSIDQDGTKSIDQPTQLQDNKQEDEFGRALPLIVNKKQPPRTETEDKQEDRAKSRADTSTSRRRNGRSQSRSRSRDRNMNVRGRESSDIRRRSANRDIGRYRGANDDRRFDDRREHNYNPHNHNHHNHHQGRHDHCYDRDRDRYYNNGREGGDRYNDDRGRDRNRNRHSYHYDHNNREMDNLKRRLVHLKQQGNRSTSVHKINEETTNINEIKSIQERIFQLEQRRRRYPSSSPRARDDDDYRRRSSRSYQDSGRDSHHRKDSRRKRNNSVNSDSSRSKDSDSVGFSDNNDNDDDDKVGHQSRSPSPEVVEGGNKNKSKKKRQRRHRSRSCSEVSDK